MLKSTKYSVFSMGIAIFMNLLLVSVYLMPIQM